ncbi:MAG: D-hexose-6-phosphate mutarotase [Deltaproteobacteria bacterium]|nr:D-hexose-6-phosphate mutarotase [Deltaproteobacteria bacterium]
MTQTLAELARDHEAPGARWEEGEGGLPVLQVRTARCQARVFAHGAHVASWAPAGQRPVLFLSPRSAFAPAKAIRGGVPLCMPWFGARADDPRPGGQPSPAHGFARTRAWRVERVRVDASGRVELALTLPMDDTTRALWSWPLSAELHVSLGDTLELALQLHNTGIDAFDLEAALHSYLEVGDVTQVSMRGLEDTPYLDKVDAGREQRSAGGPLRLADETDRIFLDTTGAVTVLDPVLGRRIVVEKEGSPCTVVWNPWRAKSTAMADLGEEAWKRFVCVESAVTRPRALRLPPGGRHLLSTRLSVLPGC